MWKHFLARGRSDFLFETIWRRPAVRRFRREVINDRVINKTLSGAYLRFKTGQSGTITSTSKWDDSENFTLPLVDIHIANLNSHRLKWIFRYFPC